jgi:hypothetical protein
MKSVLRQIKSPYGIKKSLKWLYDYLSNGSHENPLKLKELPHEVIIQNKEHERCLLFIGDLMGTSGKRIIIQENLRAWAAECDYVFGNLEGPIWDSQDLVFIKQHNSEKRIQELSGLAPMSKWIFGIANNHSYDYADQGLDNTKKVIEKLGAQWFGTKEKNKIVIGDIQVWAAATFSNEPTDKICFLEDLKKETPAQGIYPLLFLHWGTEFAHFPEKEQKEIRENELKEFKFVVGHHPHTTQPLELDAGLGTAYSLGNFYVYFNKEILKRGKLLKLYFSGPDLCKVSWGLSEVKRISRHEIEIGLVENTGSGSDK